MSIVTIRGQLGSGAPEIGRLIAEKLHVDYVDREIIAEVAAILDRPKHDIKAKELPPGSLAGRIAEAIGRGYLYGVDYKGLYLPDWELPLENVRYAEVLKSVINEFAKWKAIVIRGRGSQFILNDNPAAFHVLVVAPLGLRVKRVMEQMNLDHDKAAEEIKRYDSSRREFARRHFHARLEDPANYHLVLNTERLTFEVAASTVVNAVRLVRKNARSRLIK